MKLFCASRTVLRVSAPTFELRATPLFTLAWEVGRGVLAATLTLLRYSPPRNERQTVEEGVPGAFHAEPDPNNSSRSLEPGPQCFAGQAAGEHCGAGNWEKLQHRVRGVLFGTGVAHDARSVEHFRDLNPQPTGTGLGRLNVYQISRAWWYNHVVLPKARCTAYNRVAKSNRSKGSQETEATNLKENLT